MSLSANLDLGAFIWAVLLEWKQKFWAPKSRGSTQIKNRGPVFGATAGFALKKVVDTITA